MDFLINCWNDFHQTLDKYADPRTTNWLLMSSPFTTILICLTYLFVVKVLGPKFMENRKAYHLTDYLIAYNLFQVIFNSWIFYEGLMAGWLRQYSLICQPIDLSYSPSAIRMTHACWWYYFSKFVDFIDTVFFVLRKKSEHISILHVTHHALLPITIWFGVKYVPGGHSTFYGLINSFVHVVMYTYYLLSALGPSMRKYLWWKKYLTAFQMTQFVLMIVHALQLFFIDCDYPKEFAWVIAMHAALFFVLFKNFYSHTYAVGIKKGPTKAQPTLPYIPKESSDKRKEILENTLSKYIKTQ